MKKLLLVLLVCAMMLSLLACSEGSTANTTAPSKPAGTTAPSKPAPTDPPTTAADPLADFQWENTDGGIAITKYLGSSSCVTVPEIIENKLVVSIGDTFDGNVILEELTLPKGVTYADLSACSALKVLTSHATELYGHLPSQLEELHMPNATGFPFYNPMNYEGECILPKDNMLRVLDIPSATGIVNFSAPCLEEVIIGQMLYYFYYSHPTIDLNRFSMSADGKYYFPENYSFMQTDEHVQERLELTEENIGEYYLVIFNTNRITVNGVLYGSEN